ncbi:hypothetical protein F5B20DRAFT_532990 [Whalleya microplaca]|nr:hypothetical protein F5B20DRAFT_532990 [Whalleya microplaca]
MLLARLSVLVIMGMLLIGTAKLLVGEFGVLAAVVEATFQLRSEAALLTARPLAKSGSPAGAKVDVVPILVGNPLVYDSTSTTKERSEVKFD